MNSDFLRVALDAGRISLLDYHFALRLSDMAGLVDQQFILVMALVSQQLGAGNSCVELDRLPTLARSRLPEGAHLLDQPLRLPPQMVGAPGSDVPFILDGDRLYLARYWRHEVDLAKRLRTLSSRPAHKVDQELAIAGLDALFPVGVKLDYQKIACALALLKPFVVIAGGPGTGKTHTVTSVLALLLDQAAGQGLNIVLAAPTGKAAARLTESILAAKRALALPADIASGIPSQAQTIHRLLGMRPGSVFPSKNQANQITADVLVVDEASMLDLPMMSRLLAALPDHCRLILLGDRDQLASVEAGRVLGDICGDSVNSWSVGLCQDLSALIGQQIKPCSSGSGQINDNLVVLQESRRFSGDSALGRLAKAVNQGDAALASEVLAKGTPFVSRSDSTIEVLDAVVAELVLPVWRKLMQADLPELALSALSGFRVLCALRDGLFGAAGLNARVSAKLHEAGIISASQGDYQGRPIIITQNDHAQRLYNGDVGIIWPDQQGELMAYMGTESGIRSFALARLPAHATAYALTVHKSQGSEFDVVVLVLPDKHSDLVTRELIYTGITRAKQQVHLCANQDLLDRGIHARVRRQSGLSHRLLL